VVSIFVQNRAVSSQRPVEERSVSVPVAGEPPPRVGVILAAGRSDRLQSVTGGGSKALIRLGGLAIVQRMVLTLLSYGLEKVIVVTGYHAGPVGAVVGKLPVPGVHAIYAEGWEAGNGASLGAAEPYVSDEPSFLLVTADHLFGAGAFTDLLGACAPACLVDLSPGREEWAEGTKVRIDGDRIVAFGKHLDDPAVDCGAFVLTPDVFGCRRQAELAGDGSLAGAVTRLADRRPLRAVPIPPRCLWQDIDTPDDLRAAKQLLRRSLGKDGDGPVSQALNRPISTRVSMAMSSLRPSPDLLTVLTTMIGVAAAVLLGLGAGVVGGILTQVTSVLDGVDGELARMQLRAGPRGALLDGVLDRVVDVALIAGLAVWAERGSSSSSLVAVLAVAATAGSILSMATKDRMAALGLWGSPERAIGYMLAGRDGRLLLIAVLAILGLPVAALGAVAATSTVALIVRMVAVMHRHPGPSMHHRRSSSLDPGTPAEGGASDPLVVERNDPGRAHHHPR
jgi:choline kinase/phosphatidylglycerophosphate synthase